MSGRALAPDAPMGGHYLACTRLVRALADGMPAFLEALEAAAPEARAALPAFAEAQRLSAWLHPCTEEPQARSLLPEEFVATLEAERTAQPSRVESLRRTTLEATQVLEGAGLDVLVLKGLCFAARVGLPPGRRHQFDVDLWVGPADLRRACEVLRAQGYAPPPAAPHALSTRIWQAVRRRRPEAVTLRRDGGPELDVHGTAKRERFPGVDEAGFRARRQRVDLGGGEVATLSDRDALVFLVLSIAADIRRGACRAKHLLDLHMALRQAPDGLDWASFLDEREPEGLRAVVATTLDAHLTVWETRDAFPRLVRALEAHGDAVRRDDAHTPLQLLTRPRKNVANLVWFDQLVAPRTFAARRRARRRRTRR